VHEDAPRSAFRDKEHAYGFAAFEVDPGHQPGGATTMTVTYYPVSGPFGTLTRSTSSRWYGRSRDGH
jgi:hypothetical protein